MNQTVPCKICGQTDSVILATKDRTGSDLTTVICKGCGLIHSDPIPSQDDLDAYYASTYRTTYKKTHTPKAKHIARYAANATTRLRRLKPYLTPQSICLDVGSGSGEFLYLMMLDGHKAQGLEPHQAYAEYTRHTFGAAIHNTTIERAPIEDGSIDVITLNHVLEHLQYPLTSLGILNRWLKQDGILAVEVPDITAARHSPNHLFHFAHIYNFNHQTLCAVLQKSGFDVIHEKNNTSTSLLARKVRAPTPDLILSMPENFETLMAHFTQHTTARHYMRAVPYQRILNKIIRYPREAIISLFYQSPKEIVEASYNKYIIS